MSGLHSEVQVGQGRGVSSQLLRAGAVASFGLTVQFAFTVGLVVVALPEAGFGGLDALAESMAAYIADYAPMPLPFTFLNLYNASFALTAVVTILGVRELLGAVAPIRMQISVIAITVAATLFLATGVIPVIAGPPIIEAGDTSALRLLVGILIGTDLAATSAAGWAVLLGATAGLGSGLLPRPLSYLLIVGGVVEIVEFSVPVCLVLDPVLGTFWSAWLGMVLWRAGNLHRS